MGQHPHSQTLAVLLVENKAITEKAVRKALRDSAYEICRVAKTAAAGVAVCEDHSIVLHAAIVDLRLDDNSSGIDVIAALSKQRPEVAVICMSHLADNASVQAALRAGAVGFLVKSDIFSLVAALDTALKKQSPLSPSAARSLVTAIQAAPTPPARSPAAALSPQEQRVLATLGETRTYHEASKALGVKMGTIQTYVKRLYRKLGVRTKAQAIIAAQKADDE